jgi:hypothetical protein
LTEKPKDESKIKIKVLNPDDVIVTSPLTQEKKQHLFGSKTETLVVKVCNSLFF